MKNFLTFKILLFLFLSYTQKTLAQQCFVTNTGGITASCNNVTLGLGAGECRTLNVPVGGAFHTFSFVNNTQSNGICIGGTQYINSPITLFLNAGNVQVCMYRANAVWNSNSASLSYRRTTPEPVTVTGGGNNCSTATLSATGGANGTIFWQNTTSGGQSTANASSSETVNVSGTYYFRAGNNGCWGSQGTVNVTIQNPPTAPIAINGFNSICAGSSTTLLAVGGTNGSGADFEWGTGTVVGNNIISGQTASSIIVSPASNTTYWVRRVGNTSCTNVTNGVTQNVTVNPISTVGNISADQIICSGSAPNDIIISSSTGTVQWQVANDAAFTIGVTNIGTNSNTLTGTQTGTLTATRYFRARVTSPSCSPVFSDVVTVNVNPQSVVGNISTNQSICSGSTPTDISLSNSTGTVQWQQASDSTFTIGLVNLGANSNTLTSSDIGALSATRYYRARVTSGVCPPAFSDFMTVNVDEQPIAGAVVVTNTNLCSGDSTNLEVFGSVGNIQWQIDSSGTWQNILGGNTTTLTTSPLTSNSLFRVQVSNGVCPSVNSNTVNVNVSSLSNAGTIVSSDSIICENSLAQLNISGNVGNLQWQIQDNLGNWNNISGATGTSYNTTLLTENTSYRTIALSGVCEADTSNPFTVQVENVSNPGVASVDLTTVCEGTTVTLSTINSDGDLQWQENTLGTWQDIVGANDSIYTFNISNIGNNEFRVVSSNQVCNNASSNIVTVNVQEQSNAGVLTSTNDTVCAQTTIFISSNNSVGNLTWQILDDTNWVNILGQNFDTLSYLVENTSQFRVIAQNGLCDADTSLPYLITVDSLPIISSLNNESICGNGTITFESSVGSNEQIDWSFDQNTIETSGLTYTTPNLIAPDTLNVFFRARNEITGCVSDWQSVNAIAIENLNSPIISDLDFCGTSEVIYIANPPLGQVAEWSTDTVNFVVSNDFNAGIINAPAIDSIYVRYRDTVTTCTSNWEMIKANIIELPNPPSFADQIECGDGAINITPNIPNGQSLQWSLDTIASIITDTTFTTPFLIAPDTLEVFVRFIDDATTCQSNWYSFNAIASLLLEPGNIGSVQEICPESFPLQITSLQDAVSAPQGGNINYQWQFSQNCDGVWVNIPNSDIASYTENILFSGQRCYRRLVNNNCGLDSSNVVSIDVFPIQQAFLGGLSAEYCANDEASQIIALPSNGILSGPGVSGNNFNPSQAGLGTVYIQYQFVDNNGCTTTTLDSTFVNNIPNITFDAIPFTYCSNEDQATTLNASPPGGAFNGVGVIGNEFIPSNSENGNQQITYEYTDSNNCTNSSNITVIVFEAPNPQLLNLPDTICITSPNLSLEVSPIYGNLLGNQTNGVINTSNLNLGYEVFSYSITDANGCFEETRDSVFVIQGSFVLAKDTIYGVVGGSTISNNVTLNDTGTWNYFEIIEYPLEGDISFQNNGIVSYSPDINYFGLDSIKYLICDDFCNYCDTAKVYFEVYREQLTVPSGFSPDGDGINDFFVIPDLNERFPNNELLIVNRWGDRVFEAKPYLNDWDGTTDNLTLKISGNRLVDGTYFYVLKLEDGLDPIKGFIELKRK